MLGETTNNRGDTITSNTYPLTISVMIMPFLVALKLTIFVVFSCSALNCCTAEDSSAALPGPATSTPPT